MPLADEIATAGLSPSMRRVFHRGLRKVAAADGPVHEGEKQAIRALLGGSMGRDAPREPIEAIWPHAELFVRSCIHVALIDGRYRVQEARAISLLAHSLGLSAKRLATLEKRVFDKLEAALDQRTP